MRGDLAFHSCISPDGPRIGSNGFFAGLLEQHALEVAAGLEQVAQGPAGTNTPSSELSTLDLGLITVLITLTLAAAILVLPKYAPSRRLGRLTWRRPRWP